MTQPNETTEKLNKSDQARINGAKSHGATTSQGKANSANANLRHGAYSKRVLLDNEDADFYDHFKLTYFTHFIPEGPVEFQCVESMVTAAWRIRRMESAEAKLLNIALAANKPANEATFEILDVAHERALAVESKVQAVESLTRIQDRLHRMYERNFKLLCNARKKSGRPTPEPLPDSASQETISSSHPAGADPESPKPTIDPTGPEPAGTPPASLITQILLFLVIFAFLLLAPLSVKAEIAEPPANSSAFYASPVKNSHSPLNLAKKGHIK